MIISSIVAPLEVLKAEYIELDDTKRWIAISAKTGKNLNELKKLIKSSMENTTITKSNGVKTI